MINEENANELEATVDPSSILGSETNAQDDGNIFPDTDDDEALEMQTFTESEDSSLSADDGESVLEECSVSSDSDVSCLDDDHYNLEKNTDAQEKGETKLMGDCSQICKYVTGKSWKNADFGYAD